MKTKIFLTGSTSFLGSKFIDLYQKEFDIFGIAKHDKNHPVDMLDRESLQKTYLVFQPDFVIHLAAVVDQDVLKVKMPNIQSTQNIVNLAKFTNTPLLFMSSESVYGGKETTGEYVETDPYRPRSAYGETKVESEKIILASEINHLILRAHRFVGINRKYHKPKQFPDTLQALRNNQVVHLDSRKIFKPCLINYLCQVFVHYMKHDGTRRVILNIGVDKATTYYDFITDVARVLNFRQELIKPDGEESSWPENSTLSIGRIKKLHYPLLTYSELLRILKEEWN